LFAHERPKKCVLPIKKSMPPITFDVREDIANRLASGQRPAGIAAELSIAVKTVYRLKKKFQQEDGTFEAIPASIAAKRSFNRDTLVQISEWLVAEPKLTLSEMRRKLVSEGLYENIEEVPDASTLYRVLKTLGFDWKRPVYSDPRAKRSVIKYERCAFRLAQDNGLDPTTLLSMDETNFYFEQATRAWGTSARPPVLEKPKGKVMRRSVFATIGFKMVQGIPKAIIHWVLVHGRKSWRPLSDKIEGHEIEENEKAEIRGTLTEQIIHSLSTNGLKAELKKLGIRATANTPEAMRECLSRVLKSGTRIDELRSRTRGRPTAGGALMAPTGNARMVSEYLFSCLLPYLRGEGLKNDGDECGGTADEGIDGCPDGGKREYNPHLVETSILWDSAPSHVPTNHTRITAFHKYAQDKLGMKGVIHTPPYSAWFNPIEIFFSYIKRYVRKFAPATTEQLLQRIREATAKVDGKMIAGWFRKSGYLIPGEVAREDPPDPNAGVENRCTLPADAVFERREHVACYDEAGKLRREKLKGRKRWGKRDQMEEEEEEDLQNLSVTKRSAVRPKKRARLGACAPPEEGKTRWTGLGEEPAGLEHADYKDLWDEDQYDAVEAIIGERQINNKTEYHVKWRGYDDSYNEWLSSDKFSAGLESMLRNWKERNKRVAEREQLVGNAKQAAKLGKQQRAVKPRNRTNFDAGKSIVAILAPNGADRPFYLAKVLKKVAKEKLEIHWYESTKLDSTYNLEYKRAARGKGRKSQTVPHTATVWRHTVIDHAVLSNRTKGKLSGSELGRLLFLVKQARRGEKKSK
jgi:transposase